MKKVKLEICDIIVDIQDSDLIPSRKWQISKDGYASAHIKENPSGKVLLHRIIAERMFGNIDGKIIDHINQDTTDNRRCNLRLADKTINVLNSKLKCKSNTGYWCVYQQKTSKKWCSYIGGAKNRKHIGSFNTAKEAAIAYDNEAKQRYGEFARLNFKEING